MSRSEQLKPETEAKAEDLTATSKPELSEEQLKEISGGSLVIQGTTPPVTIGKTQEFFGSKGFKP